MPDAQIPGLIRGLEGVIAAPTSICDLDGVNGRLAYGGYDIRDLATRSTYEEVVYLLFNGDLPSPDDRDRFARELAQLRRLPEPLLETMRLYPPGSDSMAWLRAAVAQVGLYDQEAESLEPAALRRIAMRLVAQLPTMVAAGRCIQDGRTVTRPRTDLGHAANFLYMLTGTEPDRGDARALDAALILYAEHELNASTFAARVVASTLSDLYSAVTAGVATIKGPLHGGAGQAVMQTLEEIGSLDNVEAFAAAALARKHRFMGFGHRVYKSGDPRSAILLGMAEEVCARHDDLHWLTLAKKLDEVVKREKGMLTNVDFYSAPLFLALGIPVELIVPVVTVARVAGWTAQLFEQYADNRIFRPRAAYVGPGRREWPAGR